MALKGRAADARLRGIERALQRADLQLIWADSRQEAGDVGAAAAASSVHARVRTLVGQASFLRPTSISGLASKARIIGKHHEIDVVGRAALRSLVEDLHAMEPARRR